MNLLHGFDSEVNSSTLVDRLGLVADALQEENVDIVGVQYVLKPNASYAGTPATIVRRPAIARLPSVYRVQLGVRFRF